MKIKDKLQGAAIGLLIGDALCAEREGGIPERMLWKIIGKTSGRYRYTDDTEMAIILAKHIIENNEINMDKLAIEFACAYKWSRGYGPSTAFVLKKIKSGIDWRIASKMKFKDGSFGNGAAMRAPVISLRYYTDGEDIILKNVERTSSITHPNAMAIEGAKLIAKSVLLGLKNVNKFEMIEELLNICTTQEYRDKINFVRDELSGGKNSDRRELIKALGNGTSALNSCPLAIWISLKYLDEELVKMIKYINDCGGDTDTIGAMSGAIWGSYNGLSKIQSEIYSDIEGYENILKISEELYQKGARQDDIPEPV